ncbi:molybdenum ABC transporter ATP-binding protein ModC [Motilimonas pumila]|uniref:Molybdenum ABC transporter ATP-binding protein ModC n=1 Tax=Motilimonas pumila TaxID=2303987 RepID=A0A418YIE8_9GAMM|nr:molybdenum ABC transporter ATP-binding protein ModC [Motilimonas pumila]RJG50423.1 molybdenum ABC transporter ATP-binding protein ModC [Motilimonas pumila]
MLSLKISKQLGQCALDFHCDLPGHGVIGVFGVSGSGKTSLINMIAGLITPDSGSITFAGQCFFDGNKGLNLAPERRRIGYVFQDARLFPHYTVQGNLLYGCPKEEQDKLSEVVELLGIAHLLSRFPEQLSGGEKQRVAIGRALLTQPEMLLMDEPLAALDQPRKQELLPYLKRIAKRSQIPILYVTHQQQELLQLVDELLVVSDGQVACQGTLEEVWNSPAMLPWQQAEGVSSLLLAKVMQQDERHGMTPLSLAPECHLWSSEVSLAPEQQVRLKVAAKDVALSRSKPEGTSMRNIVAATITDIEVLAQQQVMVSLNLAEQVIKAQITLWAQQEMKLQVGEQVYALIKGINLQGVAL